METMSELYDIEEMPYGTFMILFNLIDRYHQEYPILTENLTAHNIKQIIFT